MELFSPGHLVVLAIVVAVLFFGWKQLPDMARSAGRSLRVFRTELKGMGDDDAARATHSALSSATAPEATVAPQTPPVASPVPVPPPAESAEADSAGKPAG